MSKLLPGENLVLKDHPHWITVVKSLIVPVSERARLSLVGFLGGEKFVKPPVMGSAPSAT